MQEAANMANGLLVFREAAWKKRCALFPEVMNGFFLSDLFTANVSAGQLKLFLSL